MPAASGMVNATYGIAVGYVLYDAGSDVKRKMMMASTEVLLARGPTLVFHGLVSLAMPAVIIHSAVHQAHDLFAREAFSKCPRVVKWGPSAVGLGPIPRCLCSIRRRPPARLHVAGGSHRSRTATPFQAYAV